MPDGTKVPKCNIQNKFMMAMSTEWLEQCNTVVGHCRNISITSRKTYAVAAASRIATLTDGTTRTLKAAN